MKKVLRILLITIGVILLLLILIPTLFKSRIEATVKEKVNENVYATVDWSRFSLSLFRGFPDLSINLHQVSVVGLGDFEGDTLMGLKRFEFRVNPFSAIRREIMVNSILLDHPLINGIVLEDGSANWDIAMVADTLHVDDITEEMPEAVEEGERAEEEQETQEVAEEVGEEKASSMGLSLKRFAIRKGRVFYNDAVMGVDAAMEDFNLELAGDFSMEETEMKLDVDINRINARYGGIRYMKNGSFGLDLLAAANMVESRYTMLENEIRINGLVLGTEGVVTMLDDGAMEMDLRFFAKETTFQTLLSMVPAVYMQDFESLKTSGSLALEAFVKGTMRDSLLPDASVLFEVKDGYFSYPDLPKDVSDVQIRLAANYDGTDMDRTTVDLERFHLLLGGNPFDIKLHVDHPVSDMHVVGGVDGMIDFATLKDLVPMEDMELEGRLTADLEMDTRMSYIEQERYEEVNLDGLLLIEGVVVETPDIPVPVNLKRVELNFTPRYVDLTQVDLEMGSSDIRMDGKLTNFIPYVFEGSTVSGALNVYSQLLDANELIPADAEDSTMAETTETDDAATTGGEEVLPTEEEELAEVAPDSLAQPAEVKIPENIDFVLALDMKKVIYEEITVENILGKMKVKNGVAYLDGLKMDVIGGEITADGAVDTRGQFAAADLDLGLRGIDIQSSYATFMTVERLAPMAKYCKGKANVNLRLNSLLDASFNPLYESVNANGRLFTRDVKVINSGSLEKISELLGSDKFRELAPNDMDIKFRVKDGRVSVDPFDVDMEESKMTVSGSHGIDMTMDYLMDMAIARSDLGAGANEIINGVAALAAGAGMNVSQSDVIKMKAKITGTFKDPKISTDLSGNKQEAKEVVKEAVKERVTQEVEKVEEQVREDAGEKADKIMKDAQEEADRIMEEARKAGDALVKEAEYQGDELMKEAGSNPVKKFAAQKSADELVRQAEKQSDKLVQEAQIKADEVMEKARAEADRI
ncbi:MAG: AsmA-like C-terminal region-containing protein [Bacteroidota bacterium]